MRRHANPADSPEQPWRLSTFRQWALLPVLLPALAFGPNGSPPPAGERGAHASASPSRPGAADVPPGTPTPPPPVVAPAPTPYSPYRTLMGRTGALLNYSPESGLVTSLPMPEPLVRPDVSVSGSPFSGVRVSLLKGVL